MRKFLYLTLLVFVLVSCGGQETEENTLDSGKIYFFYTNSCPHCHDALAYINKKYPDLPLTMVNVANEGGYKLLVQCARKFELGSQVGTPLFCLGGHYLMGWAPEYESCFDALVKPYLTH